MKWREKASYASHIESSDNFWNLADAVKQVEAMLREIGNGSGYC
jgi:hypothetical protein